MILHKTKLDGVFIIEPQPLEDERGYFARVFCARELNFIAPDIRIVQANISRNIKKDTLRGLHRQVTPNEEIKIVRCTHGAIFDVAVDVRCDSPTFGQYVSVELSASNGLMLMIPRGFAHGYQTLCEDTEILYFVSAYYSPESERGFRFDDPFFGIQWPVSDDPVISEKDLSWPYILSAGETLNEH